MDDHSKPLVVDHPVENSSAFTPESLMNDVRVQRRFGDDPMPEICFLQFDGDLTDWLVEKKIAAPFHSWPCFDTTMFTLDLEGTRCRIVARTISEPYAVLVAEQLRAAGVKLIIALTSRFPALWWQAAQFAMRVLRTITFRQLEAFIAVAETSNFTRASALLRMAQPMVSALVRDLEAELGFRLFDRTTRKVQLTGAAAEFLNDARRQPHRGLVEQQ